MWSFGRTGRVALHLTSWRGLSPGQDLEERECLLREQAAAAVSALADPEEERARDHEQHARVQQAARCGGAVLDSGADADEPLPMPDYDEDDEATGPEA
ncbi:hypothetical protein ACFYWU_37520 [Streptomyces chrestomyceticus]|uniref:hypothetical protein n=1 Tax=Streptomyces chrestomyceticus TaxID=68185 RepID=UPI0019D1F3F6|nr:hypothetical protein [Streptomyces chrestomyceticus]